MKTETTLSLSDKMTGTISKVQHVTIKLPKGQAIMMYFDKENHKGRMFVNEFECDIYEELG